MAIVTAGPGGVRMNNLGLNYEGTISPSPTNVRVTLRTGDYTDFGGDYTFGPGGQFSGIVTSITSVRAGANYFTVTGLDADAETLFALIKSGNYWDTQCYLFKDDDQITGSDTRDVLFGFEGDDVISGQAGDDVIVGGRGADELTGGAGADIFRFTKGTSSVNPLGRDTITDFSSADGDTIDLSRMDASLRTPGNDTFTLVSDFTREAGELRVIADAGGYLVQGDLDGNGRADFSILVVALAPLVATDFML